MKRDHYVVIFLAIFAVSEARPVQAKPLADIKEHHILAHAHVSHAAVARSWSVSANEEDASELEGEAEAEVEKDMAEEEKQADVAKKITQEVVDVGAEPKEGDAEDNSDDAEEVEAEAEAESASEEEENAHGKTSDDEHEPEKKERDENDEKHDHGDEEEHQKDKEKADDSDEKRESSKKNATEDATVTLPPTTPPPMPFSYMFEHPGEIAHDVELRSDSDLIPEGANIELDVPVNEQHEVDSIFLEDPSIFTHCVLIRDFAEPLRVGSALNAGGERRTKMRGARSLRSISQATSSLRRGDGDGAGQLPDNLLHLHGGVVDKTAGKEGADLEVNMFAWLSSVAGEVRVIPNGIIAKWSSKKKVPIAGYLCIDEGGPVLHTLPTPCLPTVLDSQGEPRGPPGQDETEEPSEASAPAPVEGSAPAAVSLLSRREPLAGAPVSVEPAAPAAAPAAGPAGAQAENFHVWVGDKQLAFSTKPKGEAFCRLLAEKIAEDLGDTVYDTFNTVLPVTRDPSVASFVQKSRQPAPAWTTGDKTLLVAVMDWELGDESRAPMSQQSKSPTHYEKRIFPRVADIFKTMSYGKLNLKVTVIPEVVRYTRKRARYAVGGYPFPGLYNGAMSSLEGTHSEYQFDNYDLVFVIAPQQAPRGTKGVAWVGAKGAMCNGCEELSEEFQVMVAVHELGHNLGLFHASSKSLEYGNVFDWMGNYPTVEGLSYGIGYKLMLHWLPHSSVATVTDDTLDSLNDEFEIRPYDTNVAPKEGELVGLRVSLKDSPRDLYVSYRRSAGDQAGVFLTLQDRNKPNSELVDAACHSPSQKDARLRPGWTYLDQSQTVVIYVASVDDKVARIRAYRAPKDKRKIAAIRDRPTFTDGSWKCPRTCEDSDLLVSAYGSCAGLHKGGYCKGGSMTIGGEKFDVARDLCPRSCGKCKVATSGPTLLDGGCADRRIKIGGKSCRSTASSGLCGASTTLGNVGLDLCPRSCGKCPPRPEIGNGAGSFRDPTPKRKHGRSMVQEDAPPAEDGAKEKKEQATQDAEEEKEIEKEEEETEQKENENDDASDSQGAGKEKTKDDGDETVSDSAAGNNDLCTDDPVWSDSDGDDCAFYGKTIESGKMNREDTCGYNNGAAKPHCRKTCHECEIDSDTCQDKTCVTQWHKDSGRCFACSEYPAMCTLPEFAQDCPRTCGLCRSVIAVTTPPLPTTPLPPTTLTTSTTTVAKLTPQPACEDAKCVMRWHEKERKCFKCSDWAADFCGYDEDFTSSCPKSCKMCTHDERPTDCANIFMPHTCKRYLEFGWCTQYEHIAQNCLATCGICAAEEAQLAGMRRQTQAGALSAKPHILVFFVLFVAVLSFCHA